MRRPGGLEHHGGEMTVGDAPARSVYVTPAPSDLQVLNTVCPDIGGASSRIGCTGGIGATARTGSRAQNTGKSSGSGASTRMISPVSGWGNSRADA